MNALVSHLRDVVLLLESMKYPYALVGGMALMAYSEPRFTRDADVVVMIGEDEEAERVVRQLQAAGFEVTDVLEQVSCGRLATVRMAKGSGEECLLDVLFASSGIEDEVVTRAKRLELVEGLMLPVADVPSLLALKTLSESSARMQDRIDLQALFKVADEQDLVQAQRLLSLIAERGYDRGEDLQQKFERLRTDLTH